MDLDIFLCVYVLMCVEKMVMALMMYDVELVQETNNLFICGLVNSHNTMQ